ncbi:MAG: tRNA epoxyqueuosine(34) reductase QueG [Rhizobiales bacterium 24-66-13]|jgi:epoxyqueuosine reductase|nr:MAG: tRNA epoxyqueuosine(34) reductase QueG [Rhizobiales bacterium 35-66-30]OYZ79299.1 MAG: tRNA epoxyqueuosine(34) reductase QueG [Rhizobiales bacterium 24-66-13]OZB05046.1 MAG: tRNA epoxyqueuosine(34) reductase QueG [Rhizobiales bacterium 39-66-18]
MTGAFPLPTLPRKRERASTVVDTPPDRAALKDHLRALALIEGFDAFGIADPAAASAAGPRLRAWVAEGNHGDMGWMAETLDRRADARTLWGEVRTIIMLGLNYGPDEDPRVALAQRTGGVISVYARGEDYHELIKAKLKRIARALLAKAGTGDVKVFVDTAPLMEKPLAQAAGLGWQGKHTNLVSRARGSWLFLGAIATTLDLPVDAPEGDHCGNCRACLDACPTAAFPAPYRIDARRCISYLTIEHAGPIPRDLRPLMGNRIYGCDDCLAACPWNKFALAGREMKLAARDENRAPALADLVALDDTAFRARFAKSPIKRTGRVRMVRNVLIAMGNSNHPGFVPQILPLLEDDAPLVRGAAVWALSRLMPAADFARIAARRVPDPDGDVRAEWDAALS